MKHTPWLLLLESKCAAASSSRAGSSRMGQRMGKRDADSLWLPFATGRLRILSTPTAHRVCIYNTISKWAKHSPCGMSGVNSKHFWVESGANVTICTLRVILSVLHPAFTYFVKNTVGIYVHYCMQKIKPSSQNAYITGIIIPGEEYWPKCSGKYSVVRRTWQQRTKENCTLRSFTICTLSPNKCVNK